MRQLGLSDVILLCESNDLECYSNVKVSKGSILNSKAKVVFTKPYINGYITKDTAIITINQKFEQQIEPLDLMTIVSQPPKNQIQANAFLMQTSSSIDDIHHAIVNLNVLMEMDVVSGEYVSR